MALDPDPHRLDLPLDEWQFVKASVPIACVDIVVTHEHVDSGTSVALIQRKYRDGSSKWCHIGGRIGIDETMRLAAIRHLVATVDLPPGREAILNSTFPNAPVSYFEFYRDDEQLDPHSGLDPDKHAVSWCYRYEWPWDDVPRATGPEALDINWFSASQLPSDIWPGTPELVTRTVRPRHLGESYASISSQADTHNALMWQTPLLAMTAQAFLLTIGLGAGIAPVARLSAALLSLVVSILSIQLMLKHSAMQHRDSLELEKIERLRGMIVYHVKPEFSGSHLKDRLIRRQSRNWWLVGMGAFGVVSLGVALVAAMHILVK